MWVRGSLDEKTATSKPTRSRGVIHGSKQKDVGGAIPSVIVSRLNGDLIQAAARLWIKPTDIVMDTTWGRGNFWTKYRPKRLIRHDKYTLDRVDFRKLPEPSNSVDVIVFDPPYIATGGTSKRSDLVEFRHRYGLQKKPSYLGLNREESMHRMVAEGIAEAARVLKPGGRLIVKTMDFVSGRFELGHVRVVLAALRAGLEQVDEFVHLSGHKPQPTRNPDGTPRVQRHARHVHSFLCIFRKPIISHSRRRSQLFGIV